MKHLRLVNESKVLTKEEKIDLMNDIYDTFSVMFDDKWNLYGMDSMELPTGMAFRFQNTENHEELIMSIMDNDKIPYDCSMVTFKGSDSFTISLQIFIQFEDETIITEDGYDQCLTSEFKKDLDKFFQRIELKGVECSWDIDEYDWWILDLKFTPKS